MRRGQRVLITAALSCGLAVATSSAPAGAQTACPQPYLPQFAMFVPPSSLPAPTEQPPPRGPSIDHVQLVDLGAPDTDGDGRPDVVIEEVAPDLLSWDVVVERGDGTARFEVPVPPDEPELGAGFVFTRPAVAWWGDFDGDGLDDIVLTVIRGGEHEYVVSGAAGPGVHDVTAVGVELPPDMHFGSQVGDYDGDGADDLLVGALDAPTIVSGRPILAVGPGGSLTERPPAIRSFTGEVLGILRLSSGPPTVVTAGDAVAGAVELVVNTDPTVRLRTARVPGAPGTGDRLPLRWSPRRGDVVGFAVRRRVLELGSRRPLPGSDPASATTTTTTTTTAATATTATPGPTSGLPRTGDDTVPLVLVGVSLVGAGWVLVRRRRLRGT